MTRAARPKREFTLDGFQSQAIDALDRESSVIVAAPTGAGKTVVAEHAIDLALMAATKAFYTTPIKALSNQKYHDFADRYGTENVGLLTGDTSVNGEAPIVVMTTEVLRNMLYAGSPTLAGLSTVILDEVHYLQDPYRGPVWEEVIVHTPATVRFVCLSATVSNAAELAEWMETVQGRTELIVHEERPVELTNLYMVGDRDSANPHVISTLVSGEPNPEGGRFHDSRRQQTRKSRGRNRRRFSTPRRLEVLDVLQSRDLLPAINFVFSRAGCDDAARQLWDAGVVLTEPGEKQHIRDIVDAHTGHLRPEDREVLGFARFLRSLEAGVAAHHAGMVPAFKETVEAC
ncbi:MAG: DEAD/DEAH box helicase, partial [Acidimicrobiales bacterium]